MSKIVKSSIRSDKEHKRHVADVVDVPLEHDRRYLLGPGPAFGEPIIILTGSIGHQMGIVARRRIGDGSSASGKEVAQVIGELLHLVGRESVVVPEDVVVRRSARPLDPLMGHHKEIVLRRMGHQRVDHRARRYIFASTALVGRIVWEEPSVVALLDDDKSDGRLVVLLQAPTGSLDGGQLPLKHFGELAFADAVAVEEDPLRFARRRAGRGPVELAQQVVHHVLHLFNVFLLGLLQPDLDDILGGPRVDAGHNGRNGRPSAILLVSPRMGHVRAHDDHLLRQEHPGPKDQRN